MNITLSPEQVKLIEAQLARAAIYLAGRGDYKSPPDFDSNAAALLRVGGRGTLFGGGSGGGTIAGGGNSLRDCDRAIAGKVSQGPKGSGMSRCFVSPTASRDLVPVSP